MMLFSKKQGGFTLIELVVVVAVLGVLSVFAMPKILGTITDARIAALTGMAGALTAASTHNYMIRGADSSKGREILKCTDVVELLHLGSTAILTADGYTITEGSGSDVMSTTIDTVVTLSNLDTAVDCNLSTISEPVKTMKFSAIGIN
jgi:prepilin-type N-terminal cleavage/methylation domain-containing protein